MGFNHFSNVLFKRQLLGILVFCYFLLLSVVKESMVKVINGFRNTTKYLFMYISFSNTCYITKIKITVYGLSKLFLLEFLSKSLKKTQWNDEIWDIFEGIMWNAADSL